MPEHSLVKLPEVLDISFCSDLHQQFCVLLVQETSIQIDASNVRKALTPCVQVLLAAGLEAKRRSISYEFTACSQGFAEALKSLGLSDYLDQWKVQ